MKPIVSIPVRVFGSAVAFAMLACAAPASAADVYKIIMPFAAGGASEVFTRLIAANMQKSMGETVIVENVVGANGNIGATAAARAAPDGKTMLSTSEAYTTVNPLLFKVGLDYKASDLDPLTLVATQPAVLAVKADGPIKSLDDLLKKAKADGVSYSSAGIGSTSHLAMGYLNTTVGGGLKLTHVPYTGGAPAINAIVGGTVDSGFIVAGNVLPHVRGGKLAALAVAGDKRLPQLPDVKTTGELGLPGFTVDNALVLLVPAKTPDAVKQRLATEARKAIDAPEVRTYAEANGYVIRASTPEEARKWLAEQTEKWTDLITKKNILKE